MMMTTLPNHSLGIRQEVRKWAHLLFVWAIGIYATPNATLLSCGRHPTDCLALEWVWSRKRNYISNFGVFETTLISVAKAATINRGHVDKDYLHVVLRMPTARGPVFTLVR